MKMRTKWVTVIKTSQQFSIDNWYQKKRQQNEKYQKTSSKLFPPTTSHPRNKNYFSVSIPKKNSSILYRGKILKNALKLVKFSVFPVSIKDHVTERFSHLNKAELFQDPFLLSKNIITLTWITFELCQTKFLVHNQPNFELQRRFHC